MFAYDAAVLERYPTLRAAVIRATDLHNGPSPPELRAAYRAEQESVVRRLTGTTIAEIPSVAAWRGAFRGFGADPTRHRHATESLLRRLDKRGDIPSINILVDLGNLVSIRHTLPVAVFDLTQVHGGITVRMATGTEPFTGLGSGDRDDPEQGEVVFVDRDGTAVARRWCWRQSSHAATSATTREALFVIEGHHDGAERDVEAAVADLTGLLATHQPDTRCYSFRLSPSAPSTSASAARR